jgi:hypothetical protein
MIGRAVILEENTPVEVKLSADNNGQVCLGIRINGSNEYVLAKNVTLPTKGNSSTWSKNIGELT